MASEPDDRPHRVPGEHAAYGTPRAPPQRRRAGGRRRGRRPPRGSAGTISRARTKPGLRPEEAAHLVRVGADDSREGDDGAGDGGHDRERGEGGGGEQDEEEGRGPARARGRARSESAPEGHSRDHGGEDEREGERGGADEQDEGARPGHLVAEGGEAGEEAREQGDERGRAFVGRRVGGLAAPPPALLALLLPRGLRSWARGRVARLRKGRGQNERGRRHVERHRHEHGAAKAEPRYQEEGSAKAPGERTRRVHGIEAAGSVAERLGRGERVAP